jgi:hypothetical protein
VILNDHNHTKDQWTMVKVPDQKNPYILFFSGGPNYTSGYQENNDFVFEISFKKI